MKTATTTSATEKASKNGDLVPVTLSELMDAFRRGRYLMLKTPLIVTKGPWWDYESEYEDQVGMD